MIEFDVGYFTIISSEVEQEKGIRACETVGKSDVAKAESSPLKYIELNKMKPLSLFQGSKNIDRLYFAAN
jgi:hypothetical protein